MAERKPPKAPNTDARARQTRNAADADKLRHAEQAGLLLNEIALSDIDADAMIRDRAVLIEEEMTELRLSISKNGLRMPLEVFRLPEPSEGRTYGLLSGYRRLMACRGLVELGRKEFRAVKAIVRTHDSVDAAYVAMVEENEIRSALSYFEKGRIAVIAAGQGAFTNVEDAVSRLFESASKAKRSKIRSFAQVFEDLGDLLIFPETLNEKRGLAIATALRAGGEKRFRDVLGEITPVVPSEEWALLDVVLAEMSDAPKHVRKGGRPRLTVPEAGWHSPEVLQTSSGFTIRRETEGEGLVIRIDGRRVDREMAHSIMEQVKFLLDAPR